MTLWKQLAISVGIVVLAVAALVHFVPGVAAMLVKTGVPQSVVSMVAKSDTSSSAGQGDSRRSQGAGNAPPVVVTEVVDTAVVNDRLNAIGNGEANQSVTVTPLATGNLTDVIAKSGDRVSQGQVIARLDSEDQKVALAQAQLALQSAQEKVERNKKLGNAVAIATIREGEFALQGAELDVQRAELDLKRRDIVAPSKGVVGIMTINPGDYVTASTPIAVVDDRSQILVEFWVPERFSNKISIGQSVSAVAIAQPTKPLSGVIDAIDNRVDQTSRTLRVRARIDNPDDSLRAGMSFSVSVRFEGDTFPTVNPLAIQWSADGSFVWRVADDKTQRVPVTIIQRNSDKVLVDAKLSKGDAVVMEGLQRLRDGGQVKVAGRAAPEGTQNQPGDAKEQKVSVAGTVP